METEEEEIDLLRASFVGGYKRDLEKSKVKTLRALLRGYSSSTGVLGVAPHVHSNPPDNGPKKVEILIPRSFARLNSSSGI